MKIAVIGTGYIGLVSGVCLAKLGHSVVCVDNNIEKIKALQAGEVPIFEPGLADLMRDVSASGLLHFSTDTQAATRASDAVMIAVGTPTDASGQSSDLSFVFAAARDLAAGIDGYKVIIVKSTVPTGSGRQIEQEIKKANPAADFDVVSNPEFLREGVAIFDFMNPDRIVIGTKSLRASAVMRKMYARFIGSNVALLETGLESAELIKFASNGFLATKIAFINEMAELCEATGADVQDVARGMGFDDRIGPKFLNAGPGFGGSCFPKDNRALSGMARTLDVSLRITDAVIASNDHVKQRAALKIAELAGGTIDGLNIVVFGVTFKPDTDDMREASALTIIPHLIARGATITVVDPEGRKHGEALLPDVRWEVDPYVAAQDADMIVVLTEWSMFKTLDLAALKANMKQDMLADLRNIYTPEALAKAGFRRYYHIGRRQETKQ
jgi:UDPglucose 6-dehydrogenase